MIKRIDFCFRANASFVELLQSFVDRGWVDHIDESHLIKIDKSYILQDFREKEADLVVPIVLYNGDPPWTASRSFRETLDSHEWFGDELLDFKYILIDINRYGDEQLPDENKKKINQIIDNVHQPKEVHIMISNLEKAFENFEFNAEQKGMEQGKIKGEIEGKAEVALHMILKGLEISFISEVTGLSEEKVAELRKQL